MKLSVKLVQNPSVFREVSSENIPRKTKSDKIVREYLNAPNFVVHWPFAPVRLKAPTM